MEIEVIYYQECVTIELKVLAVEENSICLICFGFNLKSN